MNRFFFTPSLTVGFERPSYSIVFTHFSFIFSPPPPKALIFSPFLLPRIISLFDFSRFPCRYRGKNNRWLLAFLWIIMCCALARVSTNCCNTKIGGVRLVVAMWLHTRNFITVIGDRQVSIDGYSSCGAPRMMLKCWRAVICYRGDDFKKSWNWYIREHLLLCDERTFYTLSSNCVWLIRSESWISMHTHIIKQYEGGKMTFGFPARVSNPRRLGVDMHVLASSNKTLVENSR